MRSQLRRELVEALVVVLGEDVEALEFERRPVGEGAGDEGPHAREPLLPVHHLQRAVSNLVEKHRRDRDVQHEGLEQLGRRPNRPDVLALVRRPQVDLAAVDLVDDGGDGEIRLLNLRSAAPASEASPKSDSARASDSLQSNPSAGSGSRFKSGRPEWTFSQRGASESAVSVAASASVSSSSHRSLSCRV